MLRGFVRGNTFRIDECAGCVMEEAKDANLPYAGFAIHGLLLKRDWMRQVRIKETVHPLLPLK